MNYDKLKALAEAATPGPWTFRWHSCGADGEHTATDDWSVYNAISVYENCSICIEGSGPRLADPEYIAAVSPDVVLAMIEALDVQAGSIEAVQAANRRLAEENQRLRDALKDISGTTDGTDCNEFARIALGEPK